MESELQEIINRLKGKPVDFLYSESTYGVESSIVDAGKELEGIVEGGKARNLKELFYFLENNHKDAIKKYIELEERRKKGFETDRDCDNWRWDMRGLAAGLNYYNLMGALIIEVVKQELEKRSIPESSLLYRILDEKETYKKPFFFY